MILSTLVTSQLHFEMCAGLMDTLYLYSISTFGRSLQLSDMKCRPTGLRQTFVPHPETARRMYTVSV